MIAPRHSARLPCTARRRLPAGYRILRRLDLESPRTLLVLGLLSVAMLIGGLIGFALAAVALPVQEVDPLGSLSPLLLSAVLIILFVVMLGAHEACHGLAFRLFGARTRYGVNLAKGVAYAAAPEDYLPRDAYLVVALAPLVGVSAMCLILMALTGGTTRTMFALVGAANVSGAAGDVWFFVECLRRGRELLVRDFGEGAELYLPLPAPTGSAAREVHEDERGDAATSENEDERASDPDHAPRQPQ